jgi:hypothetical protein
MRFVICLVLVFCVAATGCSSLGQVSKLQEENAQLAERIRQDQVRLLNLEEQNRQLNLRLAEAEKAVATLHDSTRDATIRR